MYVIYRYSFGKSSYGAMGLGDRDPEDFDVPRPRQITANNFGQRIVKQISSGDDHTLALTNNNVMYAWGCGAFGRLGSGVDRNEYTPRRVVMDEAVSAMQQLDSLVGRCNYS